MKKTIILFTLLVITVLYFNCNCRTYDQQESWNRKYNQDYYFEKSINQPYYNLSEFKGKTITQKDIGKWKGILGTGNTWYKFHLYRPLHAIEIYVYQSVYDKYKVGDTIK